MIKKFFLFTILFCTTVFSTEDKIINNIEDAVVDDSKNELPNINIDFSKKKNELLQYVMNIFMSLYPILEKNITTEEQHQKIINAFNNEEFLEIANIFADYNSKKQNKKQSIEIKQLKTLFKFVATFILLLEKEINKKNITIDIDKIINSDNEEEILNELELFCNNFSYFIDLSPIIEKEKIISLCEELRLLQSTLINLIDNINKNIEKKSYHKIGFFSEIIFGKGGAYSETKNPFKIYQNEIIVPQLLIFNQKLQEQILFIEEILKLRIQENTFMQYYNEMIEVIISTIGFIDYHITNKFKTQSGKDIKIYNKKLLEREINYITKSIEKEKKKYSLLKKENKKLNALKEIKFIKKLYEKVKTLNKNEKNLSQYAFQRLYRSMYFNTKEFREHNNLTKFTSKIITNHLGTLFSIGCAFNIFLYIKGIIKGGILQRTSDIMSKVYKFFVAGTTMNENKDIYLPERRICQAIEFITEEKIADKEPKDIADGEISYKARLNSLIKYINDTPANFGLNDLLEISRKMEANTIWRAEKAKQLRGDSTDVFNDIKSKITIENVTEYRIKTKIPSDNIHFKTLQIQHPNLTKEKYNDIMDFFIEDEKRNKTLAEKFNAWESNYKNIGYTGIADYVNSIKGGALLSSIAIGTFINKAIESIDKHIQFISILKELGKSIHHYGMGDIEINYDNSQNKQIEKINSDEEVNINFSSETFNHLRKQGVLEWPEQLLLGIEKVCKGEPAETIMANIPKCVLFTGESGSGKTLVAQTLAKEIQKTFEKYGNKSIPVNFYPIEPKHLNGFINENGDIKHWDFIAQLQGHLEEIRINGGICILYLDEFHLFFTKDGNVDQSRLADFLSFFNLLNNKQKNLKNGGGMFIIASTNKPEFIPYEFFTNGSRIGNVYEINYPNSSECIDILKTQLKKHNIMTAHINFNYLEQLMQEVNLNYSDILKIIKKAINYSIINKKIVDTGVLYYAFNETIRKINFNEKYDKFSPKFLNNLSRYYASQTVASINFNFDNSIQMFDCVTILPINKDFIPQPLEKLYAIFDKTEIKYGSIFNLKTIMNKAYSKKDLAIEIINTISGLVYLTLSDLPKTNINHHLASLYTKLYNFFALKPSNIHMAKKIQIGKNIETYGQVQSIARFNEIYDDVATNEHIQKILSKAEKIIEEFYKNKDVLKLIDIISNKLLSEKILTRSDIIYDPESEELLPIINIHMTEIVEKIIKLID